MQHTVEHKFTTTGPSGRIVVVTQTPTGVCINGTPYHQYSKVWRDAVEQAAKERNLELHY